MARLLLKETKIEEKFNELLKEYTADQFYIKDQNIVHDIIKAVFYSVADFIKHVRNSNNPIISVVFDDEKNNPLLAITSSEIEGENGMPGHFVVEITTTVPEDAVIYKISEGKTNMFLTKRSEESRIVFDNTSALNITNLITVKTILTWLKENAKMEEETELDIEDVVLCTVEVVDGQPKIGFTPQGEFKMLIKDNKVNALDAGASK